jgi:hypothetical protein
METNLKGGGRWGKSRLKRDRRKMRITRSDLQLVHRVFDACDRNRLKAFRDGGGFVLNRRRALDPWWSMIFSENRYPLFRIML